MIWHEIWDCQKRLQTSYHQDWMRNTCLKKELWYPTFDLGKVDFSSILNTSFVYCHNIQDLLHKLGIPRYNSNKWRLFIDSSKHSLKRVLLHEGNLYGAVPIGYSVCLHEIHGDIKWVIELLKYRKHNRAICVGGKIICFLFGQQRGYTKYLCFLGMWDGKAREKHWVERNCPPNLISKLAIPTLYMSHSLTEIKLHIKLDLMKKFVKALKTEGYWFNYLILEFLGLSIKKIKAVVFDGPQIRQFIKDDHFIRTMSETSWK